jgi:hypothetical protein
MQKQNGTPAYSAKGKQKNENMKIEDINDDDGKIVRDGVKVKSRSLRGKTFN